MRTVRVPPGWGGSDDAAVVGGAVTCILAWTVGAAGCATLAVLAAFFVVEGVRAVVVVGDPRLVGDPTVDDVSAAAAGTAVVVDVSTEAWSVVVVTVPARLDPFPQATATLMLITPTATMPILCLSLLIYVPPEVVDLIPGSILTD
jgi:hypothetical protein